MKNKINFIITLLVCTFMSLPVIITAQNSGSNNNLSLDNKTKSEAVNTIGKLLDENYVFPDKAKQMGDFIKSQLKNSAYDTISDPMLFADALTMDLQSITHDRHLRIVYNPDAAKRLKEMEKESENPDDEIMFVEQMKRENYGFKEVKILSGNIGYIDFRNFAPSKISKQTVASVMNFVSGTDALVFDLRKNGGGDPDGVRLICSYLFGNEPVHLNDIYTRITDHTDEYWTLRKVDGIKRPDVPVYVLTSHFTFSGAEEFAYDLKNQKRATIVGEVTGGGANPGGTKYINDSFIAFIPTGRAISPITHTNWEGTGVQPDVEIASDKALEKAEILALEKISSGIKDENGKKRYNWMMESLQAVLNSPLVTAEVLKTFSGSYGERTITFENGNLFYQRKGRPKFQMTAMSEDTFMFKDLDYFRIKFTKDSNGNVNGLTGIYDDGHNDSSPRTN